MKFKHYSIADGLSQGRINCIIQDDDGYMWFGSDNGLSKFDGYTFTVYKHNAKDTNSLSGHKVHILFRDSRNRLWIGCGDKGGLNVYNKERDNFTHLIFQPYKDHENKQYVVSSIVENNKGRLYLGTDNGLYNFHPDNDQDGIWNRHDENRSESIHNNIIRSLLIDSNNNLWIGVQSSGLDFFDTSTNQFIHFTYDETNPNSLSINNINSLCQYDDSTILIGTWGKGLDILKIDDAIFTNPESARFIHCRKDKNNSQSLSSDFIFHIRKDTSNTLWLGTESGLNQITTSIHDVFQNKPLSFTHYNNDPQDRESLDYDFVKYTYLDNSGVMWVGTTIGLNKSMNYKFRHFKKELAEQGLRNNKVQVFHEDYDENIWLGTSKGLSKYHRNSGVSSEGIPAIGAIISICGDKQGHLWLGTWDNGLFRYNPENNHRDRYKNNKNDTTTISRGKPKFLYRDKNGFLWIGLWNYGLDVYDSNTGIFHHINRKQFTKLIISIFEDNRHNLWIGTIHGLGVIKNIDNPIEVLSNSYIEEINSFKKSVNCLTGDNNGNLWIGTKEGLYQFNVNDSSLRVYTQLTGLPSNEILGIVPDEQNNLWISSINGISRFTIPNDETNPKIVNYNIDDGLQGKEFLGNAYYKCKNGQILFGGTNGFNIFDPKLIKDNEIAPEIIITDFLLFNKKVSFGEKINNNIILKKPIHLTDEIVLSHKDNFFSFWFSAVHYVAPEQNKFAYKMEGFDTEWNDIGTDRKVTFIGLKPGKYVFNLKAANCDNIWHHNPKRISITILPPWWQTIWFRLIVLCMIFSTAALVVRFRTINLKKQKIILEEMVENRTEELKKVNSILKVRQEEIAQMAKQAHEADQKQLRFFTNISHEFRTPLTLILGPLQKILGIDLNGNLNIKNGIKLERTNLETYLKLIYKNACRLNKLTTEILNFRKILQKTQKANKQNNNIKEFISEIINAFSPIAEIKKINLKFSCETNYDLSLFWFDADIIEKILYNLISNAIKFTPEYGKILIAIGIVAVETHGRASLHNNQLAIKISDTGIGIKEENIKKIFDRFYRVETHDRTSLPENHYKGTGIGLAYTRELIELHGGTISVISKSGEGSTFTVSFPIENLKHNNEITEKNQNPKLINLNYIQTQLAENKAEDISLNIIKNKTESDFLENIDTNKPTVLIVEDSPDMLMYITNELDHIYVIEQSKNGIEGFEKAVQIIPDLILSDIMMPLMDGIELSTKLKNHENTSHIPVILLTAKSGEENTLKGLETGADDYLSKPFSTPILKAKINNMLNTREIMRKKFSISLNPDAENFPVTSIDKQFINEAIKIVENNITNPNFSNDQFIASLGYGKTMVYKKIKALTDQSVSEFIRTIRLKRAAQLLLEGKYNIGEVALLVGYKHRESFYKYFTLTYGKSPSQFIKDHNL